MSSPTTAISTPSRAPLRILAETVAFACVVAFAYTLVPHPREPAIWWPPIGAVIAWLLLRPTRDWPWVLGLAFVVRAVLALTVGHLPATALWIVGGSLVAGFVSAVILRRHHGTRAPLSEPYDIVAFALVAVCVAGPLSALSTALMRLTFMGTPFAWMSLVRWSLAESVGAMIITPLVLTLADARGWWRVNRAALRAELVAVLLAAVAYATLVMFVPVEHAESRRPLLALLAIPSAWAAIRFGLFAVTWTQFIAVTMAAWGFIANRGVIAALPIGADRQVLLLQAFSLSTSVVMILVAAAFASQRRSVAIARASEARFRCLVQAAPVGMLVQGGAGDDAPYINARLTATLGPLDAAQPVTLWWARAGATPELMEQIEAEALMASISADAGARAINVTLTGPDGTAHPMELHISQAGDRRITAFVDLTERVRLEGELRQSHKLEALGTLAGGVAHDFNNILATVIGNLDLIRRSAPPGVEMRAMIDDAASASRRGTEMVRKILTFSQQQDHDRNVLALGPVFHEAAAHLKTVAPAIVTVQVAEGRDVPHVLGDPTQLHQVMMNLGANALHAMRGTGGTLSLALEKVDVTDDMVRRHPELRVGRYARVTVGDTGVGMSKATLERVFEPFFTTKHPGEGTGLGLAVVHGVVRAHDGAIIARSTPGNGTWFGVYLPATVLALPWLAPSDEAVPSLEGVRVLVLDDEPALARLVQRVVTRAGGTARAVSRAEEALALLRSPTETFDVLVTDLTMPDASGLDVASTARRIHMGLPVLLMTGYSAALSLEALRADGIASVLQKPFTPDEIVRAVHGAVHGAVPLAGAGVEALATDL